LAKLLTTAESTDPPFLPNPRLLLEGWRTGAGHRGATCHVRVTVV